MAFIDFKAVKALATLRQVAAWLGLEIKQDRCQCPYSEGDNRELVLVWDRGSFTCFGCKKKYPNRKNSGDQVQLVAHCLDVTEKKAAEHIQTKFSGYTPSKKGEPPDDLDMEFEHERIQALGISPEQAEKLGIGYRNRGTTRDAVLIPLRDSKHYVIVTKEGIKLPSALKDLK